MYPPTQKGQVSCYWMYTYISISSISILSFLPYGVVCSWWYSRDDTRENFARFNLLLMVCNEEVTSRSITRSKPSSKPLAVSMINSMLVYEEENSCSAFMITTCYFRESAYHRPGRYIYYREKRYRLLLFSFCCSFWYVSVWRCCVCSLLTAHSVCCVLLSSVCCSLLCCLLCSLVSVVVVLLFSVLAAPYICGIYFNLPLYQQRGSQSLR